MGRIGSGVQVRASFQNIASFVGRLGSEVRVSDNFQNNHRLVGRLGRKVTDCVCLCDQNADIFEVRMNLCGSYAVISRFRCSVQIRCGSDVGPMRSDAVISHTLV